jgi:isopentenyl phosphate kinase
VVVKLGGSVITDKSKPFTYRHTVASSLSRVMASSGRRLVLVHGGGSFGHSVARNHGLSSTASRSTPAAVSLTRGAMYKLNSLVCKSLREAGMNPYSYSPFDLLARTTKSFRIKWLNGLLDSRLTPVPFGGGIPESGGFSILSGDIIAEQRSSLMQAD